MNNVIEQWQAKLTWAQEHKSPIRLRGAGTKDFYGHLEGEILDTREYAGVVHYEPTELVVTVRAGTPWKDLERVLAEKNQYLPFEPPFVDQGATVGGVINTGFSGAARMYVGGIRDYVLGAHILNAQGEYLKFGGQVMKNVAGYDLSRMFVGSMGTLGLMTQISLKVLPCPSVVKTVQVNCDFKTAQKICRRFLVKPITVNGTVWLDGLLSIRLAGMSAAVNAGFDLIKLWAAELNCKEHLELGSLNNADEFWLSISQQNHNYFLKPPSDHAALWRCILPSSADGLKVYPESGLAIWGGALRWLWVDKDMDISELFKKASGHAILYRQAINSTNAMQLQINPESNLKSLQQAVKQKFDQNDILNRHRLKY